MAGIYRTIQRHTREIIHYRPSQNVGSPSASYSNGSLSLGDFEASGFFRCFTLGNQIGWNRCGKVFKAEIKGAPEGSTPLRVERARRRGLGAESKEALFEEVRILRSLDHPNVINVYLFYRDDPKYYYLVLEHLEGPDLFDYVSTKEQYHENDARKECKVLLGVINYIHDQGVVCRNLTPESILLANPNDDNSMKLVDFSWACRLHGDAVTTKGADSYFLAPEIIIDNKWGKPVDMWSLGIILYILLAAEHPFYHRDPRVMFRRVKSGCLDFSARVWTYISEDAKNFLRGLLKVNPDERMTFSSAINHRWLSLDHAKTNPSSGPSKRSFMLYNARRKLRTAVVALAAVRVLWSLLPEDSFDNVYDMSRRIGKGGFGEVYEATLRFPRDGQPMKYAVKRANRAGISPDVEQGIRSEAEILRSLDHPNIVEFYDFFDHDPRYFYLVMELMEGGELYSRITEKTNYNEEEARDVSRILLEAIKYMHDQDVVHRDLKPQNLLLASKTDDTTIRIADFGFSCSVRDGPARKPMGTPRYIAPEIINGRSYGKEVDMWAIGVIIYQLLCGTYPFNHTNQTRLFTFIRRGEFDFDPDLWTGVSEKAKDLIRGLLKVDPEQRLKATEAISHPWLIAEGGDLSAHDLGPTIYSLRLFNAKRKLRSSVQQVAAMNRIITSARMLSI